MIQYTSSLGVFTPPIGGRVIHMLSHCMSTYVLHVIYTHTLMITPEPLRMPEGSLNDLADSTTTHHSGV